MIVCQCKVVNDRQVKQAVAAGATTACEVGEACGAGTECGGCHQRIAAIIAAMTALPAENPRERLAAVA